MRRHEKKNPRSCVDFLRFVSLHAMLWDRMRQQKLHVRVTHLTSVADLALPPDNLPASGDEVVLDIVLGPRTDWFTTEALHLLQNKNWKVSPKPNCVGMRLRVGQ
ncbi:MULTISPECIES: hypothetical protein [Pectobacterium]|uniref:hypothetical protein n=1 Tax=Pectobacterium TaxID=122277 RepID=UPI0005C5049E|nr:hypothetical protein [Pectobacterium carotovorum]